MKCQITHWLGLMIGLGGLVGAWGEVNATVSVPSIFGDHMVLQAGQPIPVWGWAEPGETITVRLGRTEVQTMADAKGEWKIQLPARSAAENLTMTIRGSNVLKFMDVLVGEVWIGSGQSNMNMPVSGSHFPPNELARAANSRIRLFREPEKTSIRPKNNGVGIWQVCTPDTVSNFSAVAYFFGRKLERELKTPVGMIHSAYGGTPIEAWTPYETLGEIPDFNKQIASLDELREGMDAKLQAYEQQKKELQSLREQALGMEADETRGAEYRRPDFNDRDWPEIAVQGVNWEKTVLTNFDGVVWYRRTVEIPADWAGRDLEMRLGPVDETDVTWFNEKRVGGMGLLIKNEVKFWDVPRIYKVPGSAVKAGRNTITVRVIDTGYAGGIWGAEPANMKLVLASGDSSHSVPLAGQWKYKVALKFIPEPKTPVTPSIPTVLYNAMIHPMIPYGIRGVLWYQGESNVTEGDLYTSKMRAMIKGWRAAWGRADMPFYYVQIAPYLYGTNTIYLPKLWDAQRRALAITNTGMVVTTDLGNLRDIHPRRKVEVGERLALWALAKTYGRTKVVYTGPLLKTAVRTGDTIRLTFDGVGGGLVGREGNALSWIDIAGSDGRFVHARAMIEGDTVVVMNDLVTDPVRIRYDFAPDAEPELFNAAGLPASPFEAEVDRHSSNPSPSTGAR